MTFKQLFVIILIVLLDSLTAFHLLVNLADVKIDFLNINPSDKKNEIVKAFDYPPSDPQRGPYLTIGENGTSGLPLLSLSVGLVYDGILAERTPAYLTAYGVIYPEGIQTIDSVGIGIEGSSRYSHGGIALSNTAPLFS